MEITFDPNQSVTLAYEPVQKRFLIPYTYLATRKKIPRAVNPWAKSYRTLVIQVLRAQKRGIKNFSWIRPMTNPVLSLEGTFDDCYLYRFTETGGYITIVNGSFITVLRQLHMIAQNGNPEHQNAAKNADMNINVVITAPATPS